MIIDWLQRTKEAYFANPNAVRDFRTQMRGKRSTVLWGAYSGILVVVAGAFYAALVASREMSPAEMQAVLRSFYLAVINLLDTAVLLTAPVLAVNGVVQEFERRSIDLILSSPMSMRTFFTGKLISAWRVVWMLLLLALPVASVCVVMGGATFGEVLTTFFLISLHGLICAAAAMPIAVVARRVVPALISALLAIYSAVVVGSLTGFSFVGRGDFGNTINLIQSILPYRMADAAQSMSQFLGLTLPTWIFALPLAGAAVWVSILGAGAALTRYGSVENRRLRWGGLLAAAGASTIFSFNISGWTGGGDHGAPLFIQNPWSTIVFVGSLILLGVMPHLASWTWFGEKKNESGPIWKFREAFAGSPSGAIPYLLMAVAALALPAGAAAWTVGGAEAAVGVVAAAGWSLSALLLAALCYRTASAFSPSSGGQPKRLGTALILILGVLPLPLMAIFVQGRAGETLAALAPAAGPFLTEGNHFLYNLLSLWVFNSIFLLISERRRRTVEGWINAKLPEVKPAGTLLIRDLIESAEPEKETAEAELRNVERH